jgi:hypothetical protein
MPTIDLNVSFDDVKDADVFKPAPVGTYPFKVLDIELKDSKAGRPMLVWNLGFECEDEDTGKMKEYKIRFYSVLPYEDENGEVVVSGLSNLVSITKALQNPWNGSSIQTEDYLGLTGMVEITQKNKQVPGPDGKYIDDPESEEKVNDIKGFVK